jgi:putative membrane protein
VAIQREAVPPQWGGVAPMVTTERRQPRTYIAVRRGSPFALSMSEMKRRVPTGVLGVGGVPSNGHLGRATASPVVRVCDPLRAMRLALVTGLAAAAPRLAWAQERGRDWNWGMHPMTWMWGAWGLGMMLMMLVFWGLVIAGIVFAIRWLANTSRAAATADRALDILRERYARGEIDKDEFEAKKRDLR